MVKQVADRRGHTIFPSQTRQRSRKHFHFGRSARLDVLQGRRLAPRGHALCHLALTNEVILTKIDAHALCDRDDLPARCLANPVCVVSVLVPCRIGNAQNGRRLIFADVCHIFGPLNPNHIVRIFVVQSGAVKQFLHPRDAVADCVVVGFTEIIGAQIGVIGAHAILHEDSAAHHAVNHMFPAVNLRNHLLGADAVEKGQNNGILSHLTSNILNCLLNSAKFDGHDYKVCRCGLLSRRHDLKMAVLTVDGHALLLQPFPACAVRDDPEILITDCAAQFTRQRAANTA